MAQVNSWSEVERLFGKRLDELTRNVFFEHNFFTGGEIKEGSSAIGRSARWADHRRHCDSH